ncbi:GbsR/MarR family transcriptional regulator [Solwaraspora sp. WMMB335]|uniref:GbsR/MarR family transcriptional regulator n=1 Tax=Solwaraspora sp. WMMB335 TaxID=3404118 RepID=UPI003B96643E
MLPEFPANRRYAEEVGVVLSGMGLTPTAGKILGWLLVCDPPSQTGTDIASALDLSPGSVSTNVRSLERVNLVHRVPAPHGRRGTAYRLNPAGLTEPDVSYKFRIFRDLLERGIDLAGGPRANGSERLVYLRDFYAFVDREMPRLFERFKAQRQPPPTNHERKEARSDG